eukprot:3938369-Rhodomonas_salina.2
MEHPIPHALTNNKTLYAAPSTAYHAGTHWHLPRCQCRAPIKAQADTTIHHVSTRYRIALAQEKTLFLSLDAVDRLQQPLLRLKGHGLGFGVK